MNEFSIEFFAATTAEDQRDYFFGEVQSETPAFSGKWETLSPGSYRVVDGKLYRTISGLSPKEDRDRLYPARQSGT